HGSTRAILVEKPWALTLREADQMAAACQARDVLLALGHHWRYCDDLCMLKAAIDAGMLGRPQFFRGVGYGNLLDQGDHLLDAVLWLAGRDHVVWAMSQACDDPAILQQFMEAGQEYRQD